jgi:nucleotide-binding universal stress UspA family protein
VVCVESPTHLSIKKILLTAVAAQPSTAILSYTFGFARHYRAEIFLTGAASPQAIGEIVRKREIDFAVVGMSDRRSELQNPVGDLLRMIPCPTLLVGPRIKLEQMTNGDPEQLVYVTDFTTGSLDALPYAIALAQDYGAQIKFIHVAEEAAARPFHFGNSRIVGFRKRLETLAASGEGLLPESELIVKEGDRIEGVTQIAARLNASLIVVNSRESPTQLWSRLAGQLACRAHCPILAVNGRFT